VDKGELFFQSEALIKSLVAGSELNYLQLVGGPMFGERLVEAADGADPLFWSLVAGHGYAEVDHD